MKNVTTDDFVERSKETTGLSLLPQKYHTVTMINSQNIETALKTYVQSNLFVEYKTQKQLSIYSASVFYIEILSTNI